ncbi:MAG: hypothetical protein GC161_14265 [Planctomycetaceae bacterium]|nr:hypothetical protein [Planctomycetaceae bacterium]
MDQTRAQHGKSMGAKVGLVVLALGLLLGWWFWTGVRPTGDGGRRETAVVADGTIAEGAEPVPVRAADVVGSRVQLEDETSSALAGALGVANTAEASSGHSGGVWVKVVDEQNAPTADIRVAMRSAARPGGKPESVGTSGADGLVWLALRWETDASERRVERAGPAPRVDRVTFDPAQLGDEPVLFVLSAGAGLDVHVIDEGGGSAEGALVRLVSPADHDSVFGGMDALDAAVMVEGRVRDGVCHFARLPADTDLLLHVQAPPPLGPMSLRTRTAISGRRSLVEARYSADDVVLLGELRGDFTSARWRWSLFAPTAEGSAAMQPTNPLHVAENGHFVVRMAPDVFGALGPGVCLVVHRGSDLLEAVELPPSLGAGVVRLDPMDAALSNLCSGTVHLDPEGDPKTVRLSVSGIRSPGDPTGFSAARTVQPDGEGRFSLHGRGPSLWKWKLHCISDDWEVAEPAGFEAGVADHRLRLVRAGGPPMGRLLPGPALAASNDWADHVRVVMHASDGADDRQLYVESDGRFQVLGSLEDVSTVSVWTKWHERPILEWGVTPGAPLDVELPPDLRLVRLDVRGDGGNRLKAKAIDPLNEEAGWYQRTAESPLVVLLHLPAQDVLVQAEGYRDTLVRAVSEHRRVDLAERGVSLILRASDLPELPEEFRLRPILARGPQAAPDFGSKLEFDSQGVAAVVVSGTGEFYVHLQLERVTPSMRAVQIVGGEESPRIQVSEVSQGHGPMEFALTFDRARILEALAALR